MWIACASKSQRVNVQVSRVGLAMVDYFGLENSPRHNTDKSWMAESVVEFPVQPDILTVI